MTRADLLAAISRRTNKNTTLDTATQNRLVDFLNERNRRLLSIPGTEMLRRATISVSSAASTPRVAVREVSKVHRVYEGTNDRFLEPMSLQDYRRLTPDSSAQTGTPTHYVLYGVEAVAKQPPTATAGLYISSTSASDTTQTVYVEGTLFGNFPFAASATLNGTSAVQVGTATSWATVHRWYLSAVTVGFAALNHDTGGSAVELASIGPGQTETRYTTLLLWPTPSAVIAYTLDVSRVVSNLVQNTDQPDVPDDWHDLLLLGALMDEYQHMNDARYSTAREEYTERLGQFKYWLATNGGQTHGSMAERPSQLGAWYPAGT